MCNMNMQRFVISICEKIIKIYVFSAESALTTGGMQSLCLYEQVVNGKQILYTISEYLFITRYCKGL